MMKRLALILLLLIYSLHSVAQTGAMRQITGFVRDSLTREPVPLASIMLLGTNEGVLANEQGGFTINTRTPFTQVRVTAVGYHTRVIEVEPDQTILVIDLPSKAVALDEVLVKRGNERYSKDNNPGVDLARRLIATRDHGNPISRHDYYTREKYERMTYGLNDVDAALNTADPASRMAFLNEYADTSVLTGKRVLPVSMREKIATDYFRNMPRSHRELVLARNSEGIDQSLDQASVTRYLEDVFREIDIFANDIPFMGYRFVSPLSTIGVSFYKYFLNDTVDIDGEKCLELAFVPFNPESMGFLGRVYVVDGDTSLFVKRVSLHVPARINLNYVEQVSIVQDFVRAHDGSRLLTHDDMEVEFKVVDGAPGLFARRETSYSEHYFGLPDNVAIFSKPQEQVISPSVDLMPSVFWDAHRPSNISGGNHMIDNMLARLRQSRTFWWTEKVLTAIIKGYIPTGSNSKWDFGPITSTISANDLEGLRLRLGGMTTVNLSRHWFVRSYVAYGFDDHRLKYMGQLEYSFNEKKQLDQEFPIHSIRLRHQYDVNRVGQNLLYTNADNVLLTLRRAGNTILGYRRSTVAEYTIETPHNFMFAAAFEHNISEATKLMPLMRADGTEDRRYTEAGFKVTLRWAPGEKFYQARSYRVPINMDAPILTITHTIMPRGFMGSRFTINKSEISLQKRFWFSAFGYTDLMLRGSKIWSKVAYPDLLIPNTNVSYTIQPAAFALLDPMEFVADQSLSWDFTYWANGLLFNRIPLIRRLKLREVLTLRGMWGDLSKHNNPAYDADVYRFPVTAHCKAMGDTPYLEAGVGIDNILSLLRVDYVWRLTYRHTPGTDRRGIRLTLHLNF